MRITVGQLRKIIKETVRDTLTENMSKNSPADTARYLQANYSADLEELAQLRDSNKDVYKFQRAAEAALGERPGNMNLGMKLQAFWYDTKGMSGKDLQAAIDAPAVTKGTSSDYEGRVAPKPLPGGGYYTGD